MTRGVSWFFVAPLVLLGLAGCKFGLHEQREPWRTEAEERCLAEGRVKPSAYIVPDRAINGAGTCGMDHAFRVTALSEGAVEVSPRATLACPMTSAVDQWVTQDVQPAALAWFGQPVVKVKQMSSYSCRRMNGAKTGKISEHAFGNGLDIAGFVLADGREISVRKDWKGSADARGFLRTVQADACERFTVVLAPGSNVYHYDHIHVDLMRRASGSSTCKPAAQRPTPPNLPVFKAPPLGAPWQAGPMSSVPAENYGPEVADQEGYDVEPDAPAPLAPAPRASSRPAAMRAAPASAYPNSAYPAPAHPAAPAYPAAGRAPAGTVGTPMVLTPPTVDPYANGGYAPDPIPDAPARLTYPAQTYPAQTYPAQTYPAPAPVAPPSTPPARTRPPGLLPPGSIPLAKWLGLDTTPVEATGNVRSFTTQREFASPIPGPEAETGAD
ncbi:extensin-like protein [Ancylobacter aquaticus]|uniref:Extensin-like protein n=1 Tax=Ancylobacter aquaticus TaxID=100 RepID=A0A4R1HLL2_ANCAQ|nr:extensin family protein [Ancylobacter aquaticus]TCK23327.1 extensin-like protein [Ancylobacter aquaticus]